MPLDDLPADPQAQARSAYFLGREKWLEYFALRLERHAATRVGYGEKYSGSSAAPVCALAAANQKAAASGIHGVDGVAHEVAQNLPDLAIKTE